MSLSAVSGIARGMAEATRIRLAIARASNWRDVAYQAMSDHRQICALPPSALNELEELRRSVRLRVCLRGIEHARNQVALALAELQPDQLPDEFACQRDALELSCADVDAYISSNIAAGQSGN